MRPQFTAALALASAFLSTTAQADAPGLIEFEIPGIRALDAHAIYPTSDGMEPVAYGDRPVWEPIEVRPEASLEGQHPVVILSHGMFGHRWNQLWLGAALADAGYIAIGINHPGTNFLNRDPELSRQLWERPRDISGVIDALEDVPALAGHVDQSRIYAVGHSLGGWTVLSAAGARFDVGLLEEKCATDPEAVACSAFDVLGVRAEDAAMLGQNLHIPELKAVVALDPGGTLGFTEESLAALDTPTLIISALRTPEHVDAKREADRVANIAPVAYRPLQRAGHFDFLGICKAGAIELLEAEMPEEAFVCELGREARREVQSATVEAIIEFFDELPD